MAAPRDYFCVLRGRKSDGIYIISLSKGQNSSIRGGVSFIKVNPEIGLEMSGAV